MDLIHTVREIGDLESFIADFMGYDGMEKAIKLLDKLNRLKELRRQLKGLQNEDLADLQALIIDSNC